MTRRRDFRSSCAVPILFLLALLLPSFAAAPPASPDVGTLQAENQALKYQVERQDAKIAELRRRISELENELAIARGNRFSEPPPMTPAMGRAPRVVADTKRVIFVLDSSGSMLDSISRARSFIVSAVRQLPRGTGVDFNVVLAGEGGPRRFTSGPAPVTATTDRKLAAALESTFTSGETNLLPALNAAIDQVPDTIWLITDGDIRDRDTFANRLRQMNAGLRARINTVVAITDTSRAGAARRESATNFLREIAAQHKGTCYSVDGWLIDPDLDAKLDAFAAARAAQRRNPAGARPAPNPAVVAGPVRNLLFVVDAGESMKERLSLISPELQKAVEAMPAGTAFNVLLAAQDRVTVFRPQPVAPTPDLAQALGSFMRSYTPHGGSDLWPALDEAFNQRPSMIWLVAGSEVADAAGFLKRLAAADPQRRTRINTTAALPDVAQAAATSPKAATLVDLLTRIAADYHGRCTDLAGAPVAPPAAAPTTSPATMPATAPAAPTTQPGQPKGPSRVFDDL
jgi:hypothetical protein